MKASEKLRLKRFGERINGFCANFAVCDSQGELLLFCDESGLTSDEKVLAEAGLRALNQNCESGQIVSNGNILSSVLNCGSDGIAAIIDFGSEGTSPKDLKETKHPCHDKGYYHIDKVLTEILSIFVEDFNQVSKSDEQVELISGELSQTYEELMLLHKLSTHMNVSERDGNFLQMACDSLRDLVNIEGIAILVERTVENDEQLTLAAGAGIIDVDDQMIMTLYERINHELRAGKEVLLDSEVDIPFKYDWPENIRSIIAVPLLGKTKQERHLSGYCHNGLSIIGIMVAVNITDKPDFDTLEAKLFNSVANACSVFVDNGKLFADMKELFIGSLMSLTSSIDAKDEYTRGHSERVAFISRWIAERLKGDFELEEAEIHQVYLAGLLHDIGKLGVSESVLCKQGKLTEEEYKKIQKHPQMGADILGGIKQMKEVVKGVLCHHERMDGRGYPNALIKEEIPLVGRILGVADSFDAMTSRRTYRDAMTIERATEEIEKGMGMQFDEYVARVFLDSDIYGMWDIMEEGLSEDFGDKNFLRYGTIAVGALIR